MIGAKMKHIMPKVMVLPEHIASQIAAGEVVERPASVVKELIENSIDAGATEIEIAIGSDCRDIRIADNGCGMDPEDAILCFQSHATSKLASVEDLNNLRTLGFRGEALPSIASISHFTCYTKTADAAHGTKVETADGKITAHETGCANGTIMEVTDLFYNVPARLKFLKKSSTEFAHIHEIVQQLAISYPKIIFQLLNQGEVVLRTSGSGRLALTIQEAGLMTGKEELLPVTGADLRYGLAVYGYVARPPHCRGDRKGILAIVNNRPVRCPLAYKALDQAFSDLIPKGRYPLGVLTVTIDPGQVDVNIHPTKKEIKYANNNEVFLAMLGSVRDATRLANREAAAPAMAENTVTNAYPDSELPAAVAASAYTAGGASPSTAVREPEIVPPSSTPMPPPPSPRQTFQRLQQLNLRDKLAYTPPTNVSDPRPSTRQAVVPATLPAGWRIAGYIHNTYILLQTTDGLEIVEQHIAHERVVYERILAQQTAPGQISESSQRLVISAPLNLTPAQKVCLEENLDTLKRIGYDFEIQKDSIACTQIPLELASKNYAASVQENVESVLQTGTADFQLDASKSIACQAAIKNGMPLSESEIVELLSEWHKCPRNDTCPHGRPISLKYSKEKLFQLFHPA